MSRETHNEEDKMHKELKSFSFQGLIISKKSNLISLQEDIYDERHLLNFHCLWVVNRPLIIACEKRLNCQKAEVNLPTLLPQTRALRDSRFV